MDHHQRNHHIVLLTLERHQEGVWITRLVEELQRDKFTVPVKTTVLTLESVLNESSISGGGNVLPASTTLLVNRVSDAASPSLAKACMSFLHLCNVPVVNGADVYALCASKWCHHMLFAKAGLSSPRTRKFYQPDLERIQTAVENWDDPTVHRFLLKPNAGGFGEGITEYNRGDTVLTELPVFSDEVVLLQEYHDSAQIYRVWFLNGRVLCGTVRSEITSFNGCAASNIVAQDAYDIPEEVRVDIEDLLLPLLPNALTGSVEFLYHGNKRLYFDLNLLSTLPLDRHDVWRELASCILARSCMM